MHLLKEVQTAIRARKGTMCIVTGFWDDLDLLSP